MRACLLGMLKYEEGGKARQSPHGQAQGLAKPLLLEEHAAREAIQQMSLSKHWHLSKRSDVSLMISVFTQAGMMVVTLTPNGVISCARTSAM